ncbi:D-glycero-alpha-D-manno-heptose-1,7-bisphosphate 7-phosphatase [Culicoidibacter larvae]|uniref:D,D-heptose 1,7-bisphosphate phosphatase n=1 Tax=Culicoidibacter larvae TaxID=2579976 RepID=A0A5R8Q6G6_9FIRM|nr:HAD-IIIA family hydrolase [Culicoidibacter larvae]TLG70252.1 HAD-IIIA family hydrolase [Culicoidibacter larvae]
MKVAFLDRDGTIINDYPDLEWANVKEPEFFEQSIDSLKEIKNKGYEIIIVTNQYLINDGIISYDDYYLFANKFESILNKNGINILHTYFCPHNNEDNCTCKKPNPGMIKQALTDYPEIELENSFMVGDSQVDIGLAKNFDLKVFGINQESDYSRNIRVGSLADILSFI